MKWFISGVSTACPTCPPPAVGWAGLDGSPGPGSVSVCSDVFQLCSCGLVPWDITQASFH